MGPRLSIPGRRRTPSIGPWFLYTWKKEHSLWRALVSLYLEEGALPLVGPGLSTPGRRSTPSGGPWSFYTWKKEHSLWWALVSLYLEEGALPLVGPGLFAPLSTQWPATARTEVVTHHLPGR